MSYRVVKKSFKGNMLCLAEESQSDEEAKWYFLTPPVKSFASKVKAGDVIADIKTENKGKDTYISRLEVTKNGFITPPSKEGNSSGYQTQRYYNQKSPEENERITRLSVLSSTATIVASFISRNDVDYENLIALTGEVFDALVGKVKENETTQASTDDQGVVA